MAGQKNKRKASAPARKRSARKLGKPAPPIDDNAGHTNKQNVSRSNGTSLDWWGATPDEPAKNLYEVLTDAVIASEDDFCWFSNVDEKASWLLQQLKKFNDVLCCLLPGCSGQV